MRLHYLLIVLIVLLTACGGRKINTGIAQKAIIATPQEILGKDDIEVVSVSQTSGSSAIAETRVRTAFRLQKVDNKWVVRDIRIGQGQWEKIDDLASALERVKAAETRLMLDRITAAVKELYKETGSMPSFKDYVALSDILAPEYLDPLIRLDAWRKPFEASATDSSTILIVSAGPDGLFNTEDDLTTTITP